jgi:hypothetical protein
MIGSGMTGQPRLPVWGMVGLRLVTAGSWVTGCSIDCASVAEDRDGVFGVRFDLAF